MIKKITSIFLVFIMVLSLIPFNAIAEDEPILIHDEEEFFAIRIAPDKHYRLVCDIDLSKFPIWLPIGKENLLTENIRYDFTGILDGNGHTIKNINANEEKNGVWYGIVSTNYGTIKNLYVENVDFHVKSYAAVIAGANYGSITNCHIKGASISTIYGSKDYGTSGGIVSFNKGVISECSVEDIDLYSNSSEKNSGYYMGGIAALNGTNATIERCMVKNISICAKGDYTSNTNTFLGGITGFNSVQAHIDDSYVMNVSANGVDHVGGIAGNNSGFASRIFVCGSIDIPRTTSGNKWNGPVMGRQSTATGGVSEAYYEKCLISNGTGTEKTQSQLMSGVATTALSSAFENNFLFVEEYYPRLKWEEPPRVYTVNFYGADMETIIYTAYLWRKGQTVQAPEEPEKEGYVFTGWSTDAYLTGVYEDLDVYPVFELETGDGSEKNPYHIYTAQQLNNIAWHDSAFIICCDIDASTFNGGLWKPIEEFSGTLYGNGKKVKNLKVDTISSDDSEKTSGGLFTRNHGVIINLEIVDAEIKSGTYAGILSGTNSGRIERCYVSGTVESDAIIGGIVGQNNESGVILYSKADSVTVRGTHQVGGFAGQNAGTIEESYANANVENLTGNYASGFVAYLSSGTIRNCYSLGTVRGKDYTGGFIGRTKDLSAIVENCYTHAKVYSGTLDSENGRNTNHPFAGTRTYNINDTSLDATLLFEVGNLFDKNGEIFSSHDDTNSKSYFKTAEELKDRKTYLTWANFDDIWTMEYGYPTLLWSDEIDIPIEYTIKVRDGITQEIISEFSVKYGNAIGEIVCPDKDGAYIGGEHYRLNGFKLNGEWIDPQTTFVTSDIELTADYSRYFVVLLISGADIERVELDEGEFIKTPKLPDGYIWYAGETIFDENKRIEYDIVLESGIDKSLIDECVVYLYESTKTDKNGILIYDKVTKITVIRGEEVTLDEAYLSPDGYKFVSWGESNTYIVQFDMHIFARYEKSSVHNNALRLMVTSLFEII